MLSEQRCATAATAALAFGAFAMLSPAIAGDDDSEADTVYPLSIVTGGDFARRAAEGYVGAFYSLNGDLDADGWIVRAFGSRGQYKYFSDFDKIHGDYWQSDAMLGYQWVHPGLNTAVYIGMDYQDYGLSRFDPSNKLRGTEFGVKVAVDLETNGDQNSPLYAALDGSYSTAFNYYFIEGRVGYTFGSLTLGPEAWVLGDISGTAERLGGFMKLDIPLPLHTSSELIFSLGHQFINGSAQTNFGAEGLYGTVALTISFGRSPPSKGLGAAAE